MPRQHEDAELLPAADRGDKERILRRRVKDRKVQVPGKEVFCRRVLLPDAAGEVAARG